MDAGWYAKRLAAMSPSEVLARGRDAAAKATWRLQPPQSPPAQSGLTFPSPLPSDVLDGVEPGAAAAVVACADEILRGSWPIFDRVRTDMDPVPDWFLCVATGLHAPSAEPSFSIQHRDESSVGNVKYIWEASRHHHLTVLGSAYALTGETRYAERATAHLEDWMTRNPFLFGIHWTSGIEVGMRLISWVWLRRLLTGWGGTAAAFEENPVFVEQLWQHQRYLAQFQSHGTSANNHLIAEVAGLFAASCAFPWFDESADWSARSRELLQRELAAQTFATGLNKELATAYHGFVLELALAALVEGELAEESLGTDAWAVVFAMFDALASIVDERGLPPRQGDSDDGHGLLLDQPSYDRWASLLDTARLLAAVPKWWPDANGPIGIRAHLWGSLVRPPAEIGRPARRTHSFVDAGVTIVRDLAFEAGHEIWCAVDHGPHGYLSTSAHAHADALNIEVRHGGVEILADPGTFAYHGDPEWREYFRSTAAHNTIELFGRPQSEAAGPFLWSKAATGGLLSSEALHNGDLARLTVRHDGYTEQGASHIREIELDREHRVIRIGDRISTSVATGLRMLFHVGPEVHVEVVEPSQFGLSWHGLSGPCSALLVVPDSLDWHHGSGQEDPISGWYSPGFGERQAITTIVGTGTARESTKLLTQLRFDKSRRSPRET